ncbi:MAG: sigma-54-dependent Fis family transcriptional regulator [Calditrichaeota bacterium]|nr:sigma-54-dependent Fis family transcriptional regulator [Calditrichota bacterium]
MKKNKKILLIDDDESLNKVLSFQLDQMGMDVKAALDGASGLQLFNEISFDVIITDLQLPDISGMELLENIRRLDKNVIIVIITAFGTVDNAIEAVKKGADDYLTKPFGKETLRFVIEKALRLRELQQENVQLKSELYQKYDFSNIIGKSGAMQDVLKLVGQVAESDATVLIRGESGTGKELIARALHYNSLRKGKPMITVNCPSIPENLIESELFGHVKGAFTGALRDRKGKFELAEGSTIFLDEIGDLKLDLQARLLRVLQEKEIERVGDSNPIRVDARVVAATNKNLEAMVEAGEFREDLYYRLNVVSVVVPPLRERKEDIPFFVDFFIQKYSGRRQIRMNDDALSLLLQHDWPGNVRELENAIERAIVTSPNGLITVDLLKPVAVQQPRRQEANPVNKSLQEIEQNAIADALNRANGNQTKAARLLGIPRHVLLYRMKKYGMEG